jgi:50S ribosomal protein L16 3-hydroxylase
MQALVAEGAPLRRNPASRFAFVRAEDAIMLFVDGASHDCIGASAVLAEQLCADEALELDPALADDDAAIALLVLLHNQGSIAFEDMGEDDEEDDAWDD